ncbi:nitroreductase/quinone reductase family protein [Cryobacterium sp. PH31-L1]|uniref:nitroreductase/quinone reductase family protein n=1 Tax=Cryobacterium sp. PH31-L1 TaxID=3046199 RepID=UPI0024BA8083|nr:nitroreductase/quinone reductase family protein [Cryobacterium sp. PH31-L1]MDJ0378845.1 nitroreductase/quinone reductase family protein [Cryobacterium sp. PH31-L1]
MRIATGLRRTLMRMPVLLYRRSNGRIGGRIRGVSVLLLTVAGRTTGVPHTVPVSYFEHDGAFLVVGSGGGSATEPQWFRNLRQAAEAEVQVGPRTLTVTVRVAADAERATLWRDVIVARAPFFAPYEHKAGRTVPIAVLRPR